MNFADLFVKVCSDIKDMKHYIILLFIIVSCLLFFYYVSFMRFREQIWKLEVKVQQLSECPDLERLQKI